MAEAAAAEPVQFRPTVERVEGELVIKTRCRECGVGLTLSCRDEETGEEIEPVQSALNLAAGLICDLCASEHEAARERAQGQLEVGGQAPPKGVADAEDSGAIPF